MQRKPGFPVANCSIKMPDNVSSMAPDSFHCEEDVEQQQRRQQLINFGHAQWGFNNWNWTVTKQELDFVDLTNGKYCAGVVAFVSVSIKNLDIHRENIGYATSVGTTKGFAIYKSRKCAVTNALRETLLSFGGNVAAELMEQLETHKPELPAPAPAPIPAPLPAAAAPPAVQPVPGVPAPSHPEPATENNQNILNRIEPKNSPGNRPPRKDADVAANMRPPPAAFKPVANPPPVARAHPMPAPPAPVAHPAHPAHPARPRAPAPSGAAPAPPLRPNSNEVKGDDEEARAERKRRQRQAQEEFRQRQMMKQHGQEDRHSLTNHGSSFDQLLLELKSQEDPGVGAEEQGAPADPCAAKRRAVCSKLDILKGD